MGTLGTAQSDLVKKPAVEQAAILAALISGAWKGHQCANAKVSLEKTYDNRSGGWLVSCNDGQGLLGHCARPAQICRHSAPLQSGEAIGDGLLCQHPNRTAGECRAAAAKVATADAASLPTTTDEQAAYCMEASFGYTERLTRLVAILRDNREKGQALLEGTNVPPAARAQLAAQMKSLDNSIASNDAKRKTWDGNTTVFITYMQKHDLTKDSTLIASMSGQVRRDQEAVQSTYQACLRSCAPNDASCKATCNEKADSSDANMRMLRCTEIATQFK
jgi:hypothetical protein